MNFQSSYAEVVNWKINSLKVIFNRSPLNIKTLIYMAVGLYGTHSFEWPFLLKFLCTKIVKQSVFLVQSIVFIHIFLIYGTIMLS